MVTDQKLFLTIEETAKVLRVSNLTIYRKTKSGDIPSIKVGRYIRVPISYIRSLSEIAPAHQRTVTQGAENE